MFVSVCSSVYHFDVAVGEQHVLALVVDLPVLRVIVRVRQHRPRSFELIILVRVERIKRRTAPLVIACPPCRRPKRRPRKQDAPCF